MTFVKYGIASVFVASAALLACGGSDGGGGSSAGASSSSAGKGSGGATSMSGGSGGTSNGAGGAPVGSGGSCTFGMMGPDSQLCPAALTCVQSKCKSQFDTASSATGPCASYVQCSDACNCEQTCVSQCPQTSDCQAASSAAATCIQSNCLTEVLSCLNTGSGGAGSGGKTCADLNTCCATLTDADNKASCNDAVAANVDLACEFLYGFLCN